MRQYDRWLLTADTSSDACWCKPRKSTSGSDLREAGRTTTLRRSSRVFTASPDIHARRTSLRRYVQLHFTDVDVGLIRCLALFLTIGLTDLFLATDFVDFVDEGVAEGGAQPQDEVDDPLLEGLATRVDIVQSAYLDDEFEGALSDFGVFVHAPLACKACHLLIVFANDHFECTLGKFLT